MGKKIYVNGGILVDSRYFRCMPDSGALFSNPPEGAEIIEPIDEREGSKCLIIDDKHPQSIFNSFFAKSWFTQLYEGADFLNRTYEVCFIEAHDELKEIEDILEDITPLKSQTKDSLLKFLYINVNTIVDSLICSLILSTITQDENSFTEYADKMFYGKEKDSLMNKKETQGDAIWELTVMTKIMEKSYCNIETIQKAFKTMHFRKPNDIDKVMEKHFRNRHILAHRNGKMKDGKMVISESLLRTLMTDAAIFIEQIKAIIEEGKQV